jgi:hypothetical protein
VKKYQISAFLPFLSVPFVAKFPHQPPPSHRSETVAGAHFFYQQNFFNV